MFVHGLRNRMQLQRNFAPGRIGGDANRDGDDDQAEQAQDEDARQSGKRVGQKVEHRGKPYPVEEIADG